MFRLLLALALVLSCSLAGSRVAAQASPDRSNLPPSVLRAPRAPTFLAPISARLRLLDDDLRQLAAASDGRMLRGIGQIVIGAGLGAAGAFVHDRGAGSLLLLLAADAIGHGTVVLTLTPDASPLARDYALLPALNGEQVRTKLAHGERALTTLAQAGRRSRIVDGSITMTVAAAYVPLYWWLTTRDHDSAGFGDSALDYVAIALSVINFGTGLVLAVVPSEPERMLRRYERERTEGERAAPGALERLALQRVLRPLVSPHQLGVRARFAF